MTAYIEADRRALADEMRVLETKLRCYTSADMKRPKGLTLTAVLMVICSTMLLAAIDYTKAPHVLRQVTFLSIAICIGYVFVWFYWKGKDWARIAVLICSVGSIYNLRLWNRVSLSPALLTTPSRIYLVAQACLGVALLWWLNTHHVREFFKQDSLPL
jgi:hypothetical protein